MRYTRRVDKVKDIGGNARIKKVTVLRLKIQTRPGDIVHVWQCLHEDTGRSEVPCASRICGPSLLTNEICGEHWSWGFG